MAHDHFVPHLYECLRAVKDRYNPANLVSLDMSVPPTQKVPAACPRAEARP